MEKIGEWVNDNDGHLLFLLTGFGRSAIAQTFATNCVADNKLTASFFFTQALAQCSSVSKVILTLAYQLTISVPPVQELIKAALQADPSIPNKNLGMQFTKLIYLPILALDHLTSPMVIIIKALDECEDNDGGRETNQNHYWCILAILRAYISSVLFFYQSGGGPHLSKLCSTIAQYKDQLLGPQRFQIFW
jgi:hypothetical protein